MNLASILPPELTALRAIGLIFGIAVIVFAIARRRSLRNVDVLILLGAGFGLVIVSGTAETVGAVELGGWDERALHGLRLSKAQVEDVFRTMATESADDRRHNPGLPAERVDFIVAGCCILVTIMRRMGFADCVVSTGSVRDALASRALSGDVAADRA